MTRESKEIKCDRCGESVFLNRIENKVTDGGFTKTDIYEPKPEGWSRRECKDLCPFCTKYFEEVFEEFMTDLKD